MFLGINKFWALLRLILAKMSLSRAQNIFMPANINSIVISFYEDALDMKYNQRGAWLWSSHTQQARVE